MIMTHLLTTAEARQPLVYLSDGCQDFLKIQISAADSVTQIDKIPN